jgi:hypothetical protein
MKTNEIGRAQAISRATDAAQGGVGPDEAAYLRVFPPIAPSKGVCDLPGCKTCEEIARVQGDESTREKIPHAAAG